MTTPQGLLTKVLAWIVGIALIFGIGGYLGYHFTDKYLTAQFNTQIDTLNTQSAQKIALITKARDKVEAKQASDAKQAQVDYDKSISLLNSSIAQLRADNVRLHDPGRNTSGHSTRVASVTSSSSSDQQSGSTLSSGATDFLLSFAGRADTVRLQLIACQADDSSIRSAVDDYNNSLMKIDSLSSKQTQNAIDKQ